MISLSSLKVNFNIEAWNVFKIEMLLVVYSMEENYGIHLP